MNIKGFDLTLKDPEVNFEMEMALGNIERMNRLILRFQELERSAFSAQIQTLHNRIEFYSGEIMGMLKAKCPNEEMKIFIKQMVDEHVRTKILDCNCNVEPNVDSLNKCFGISMDFVFGFSNGYAFAIYKNYEYSDEELYVDICKNKDFFLKADVFEYQLNS